MRRLALLALALAACDPGDDGPGWLIQAPRLLAVVSEPAEVPPGASLQITAVTLGPAGPADDDITWGRCARRKPLTELGPVDPACLEGTPGALVSLGQGAATSLVAPADACRLFGPDRPEPKPGEPAGRPVDPDPSGGYYLPLRAALDDRRSAAFVRLRCDLSGATQQAAIEFGRTYRPNTNPALDALRLTFDGTTLDAPADGGEVTLPRGRPVALAARWPVCPRAASCGDQVCSPGEDAAGCPDDCQVPRGCAGAEEFALYDPSTQQVSIRREVMRASWYATAGSLDADATAPASDEVSEANNSWRAPDAPGEAWLAVVLRDERGGVGFRRLHVRVE